MLPKLASNALLSVIWDNSIEGIALLDKTNHIVSINPAYTDIMGFTPEEAIGAHSKILRSGYHDENFYKKIWDEVNRTGKWTGEMMVRRKNGEVFSEWLVLHAIQDEAAVITHYLAIFSDITERRTSLERIRYLANFDLLTKLPNHVNLVNHLDELLKNIPLEAPVAVLSIGIDGFKNINASFGLEMGDKLLQSFANRLQSCFSQGGHIARVSGDKFVAVIPNIADKTAVSYMIQSILAIVQRPYLINNQKISITASVGISICPDDGSSSDNLLKNAETALFQAKRQGRGNYQFFAEQMNAMARERFTLENELRYAIENQQFELYYHPIVSLETLAIVSVEALIRWNHPGANYISPDKFIPVAEDSGLIIPITEWVLTMACQENAKWQLAGLPLTPVAVNIPVSLFEKVDFKNTIVRLLEKSQLKARSLKLEITESMFVQNPDTTIRTLIELREMGIHISMDDFGTGYSSFSHLKKLPVDDLKIDRFFIRDIDQDDESKAIVLAIIQLAKMLKLKVIAEGVETVEQIDFLRANGCDYIQGYYFSQPVNALDLMKMLSEKKQLK